MSFRIAEAIVDLNPRVIPIQGDRKAPSIAGWPAVKDTVEDWLKENGGDLQFDEDEYNRYGIVLDADTVVVDIDCHDGAENGYSSLHEIQELGGPDVFENCGLIVKSPSGGRHLFFRKDPALKIPKNSQAFPAIDLLTKGCQVIGAGSTHVDGGEYEVEKWTGKLTVLDNNFFDWFRPKRAEPVQVDTEVFESMGSVGKSPLDDFNTSANGLDHVKSLMESAGYAFTRKSDHWEYVRPNKSDFSYSCSGTLGRVNSNGRPYLKNFSTSDGTFPADKAISLSEAFRLLRNLSQNDVPVELSAIGFGEKHKFDQYADPMFHELFRGKERHMKHLPATGEELEKSYPTMTFDDLIKGSNGGRRREWIIENLLRRGEVMNVIAAPKTGKSWMVYNLAMALSCGKEWMGYRSGKDLKVLICDNELHKEELAFRVQKVAGALGANPGDKLQFTVLRGSDVDVEALDRKLDEVSASRFDIIVIDAFYRILPKGMSENDNASMTQIFNKLDSIASKNECAIINIHHSSKGEQGDKSVTDVGSGAGAISRAADTHLAIRRHVEDGYVVIDAVTRSGISPKPVTARFNFPLWELSDVEPELRTFESARDKMNSNKKGETEEKRKIILDYMEKNAKNTTFTAAGMHEKLKLSTWPVLKTFKKHLKALSEEGLLKETAPEPGTCATRYSSI